MDDTRNCTRRNFLKAGLAAAGTSALTAKSLAQIPGANERLNVGLIGCGAMGGNHLDALLTMGTQENVAIQAVCDVYTTPAKEFQERIREHGGEARVFQDYNELLALDDLDYVVIATPEHSHHRILMSALDEGKHIYCEKPLCQWVSEAKKVVSKVKQTGLKVQVGIQGMSDDSYSSAYDAIRAGKLGPVTHAQIDYVRNHDLSRGPWRTKGLDPTMAKPDDLDWDAWQAPRRKRPWDPRRYFEWRCYREYSGGIATDLFIHRVARLLKSCGLERPSRAASMGGIYLWDDGRDVPDSMETILEYAAVDRITPGMTVHLLGTMGNKHPNQHCIRGHEATLVFKAKGWEIISQKTKKVSERYRKTGSEDISRHHQNLQAAIREGAELNCPVRLGLNALIAVNMGNESWRRRKMVEWDPRREKIVSA